VIFAIFAMQFVIAIIKMLPLHLMLLLLLLLLLVLFLFPFCCCYYCELLNQIFTSKTNRVTRKRETRKWNNPWSTNISGNQSQRRI